MLRLRRNLFPSLLLVCLLGLSACPQEVPTSPPEPTFSLYLQDVGNSPSQVIACVTSLRGCSSVLAAKLVERSGLWSQAFVVVCYRPSS